MMLIGMLATRAGVGTKTIRYYEVIGLLPAPKRTPNGYRSYTEDDLTRLQFIRRAQAAGLNLSAIREILSVHDAGQRPCQQLQLHAEEQLVIIDRRMSELQTLRASLAQIAERAREVSQSQACRAEDICSVVTVRGIPIA